MRRSRRVAPGTELVAGDGIVVAVVGEHVPGGERRVRVTGDIEAIEAYGVMPLPRPSSGIVWAAANLMSRGVSTSGNCRFSLPR